MALELICYRSDASAPIDSGCLAETLDSIDGVELGASSTDGYRPWRWCHPETGAVCDGDLGPSPLEADQLHPPKRYDGFVELDLRIQMPLAVPHWFCIDICELVRVLETRIPGFLLLDSEDTMTGEVEGPAPLDSERLQNNWISLNEQQMRGLDELPRMDRDRSSDLWHYRRALPSMRRQYPALHWPAVLVLQEQRHARSVCIWTDPEQPWALPPVELVVIHRGDGDSLLWRPEALLDLVPGRRLGLATALEDRNALRTAFSSPGGDPPSQLRLLADGDWAD